MVENFTLSTSIISYVFISKSDSIPKVGVSGAVPNQSPFIENVAISNCAVAGFAIPALAST